MTKMQSKLARNTMLFKFTILMALWLRIEGQLMPAKFDFIVAQDGSGDFKTITEAISQTPNFSSHRVYIKIKDGVYNENVIVDAEKTNITFIGDSMERTIISAAKSNGTGSRTYDTATVGIFGEGFVALYMTFQNAATDSTQAVALLSAASHTAYYRCRFLGYQDTLYAKRGVQYFRECEISGTTDFIFGDAAVVFQNCDILVRNPLHSQSFITITAQGRESKDGFGGTILHNCIVRAETYIPLTIKVYMGRPWRDYSRVVVMQSFLGQIIDPRGWLEWEGQPQRLEALYYAEYDNRGPMADTSGRVQWPGYKKISSSEATQYTVRNFINGEMWIPPTGIPVDLDLISTQVVTFTSKSSHQIGDYHYIGRVLCSLFGLMVVISGIQ